MSDPIIEPPPLLIEGPEYRVEINIRTTRRVDVEQGKSIAETKSYTINDDYTEEELLSLLRKVEPISGV